MAGRVISIEIGSSVTRMCEMDFRTKEPKVYKNFCIPTPQGVVEDGFVQEKPEFVTAIKKVLNENKIKTKQAVFTVTSSKIVTREIVLPALKLNQIEGFIKANVSDYFPIDLSAYELAHIVLGSEKSEDGKEKHRVLAMAAGKDLVAGYTKLASACGLKLVSLDYSGNSVYQIMKNEVGNEAKLVIKIEDNFTIASIISEQRLVLQRNIAYGFERAVQTYMDVSDSYDINSSEAFAQMCNRNCLNSNLENKNRRDRNLAEPVEMDAETQKRVKVTETFAQLIGNLARVIELYNTKGAQHPVSEVVLVGMGAEIEGLALLLSRELHVPATTVQNFSSVITFGIPEGGGLGRYVGVIGASLAPVNLVSSDNKNKERGSKKVPYTMLTVLVYVVFVVVIGVMLAMAYVPLMEAQKKETELKMLEAKYAEAEVVYNQYLSVADLYHDVNNAYKMTEHSNDELVAFFVELEEKMPSDLILTEFYSDAEMARMVMNVPDLEQAAKIFQILREFESLQDVTATEIDADGEVPGYYSFEVNCYYYPIVIDESSNAAE